MYIWRNEGGGDGGWTMSETLEGVGGGGGGDAGGGGGSDSGVFASGGGGGQKKNKYNHV